MPPFKRNPPKGTSQRRALVKMRAKKIMQIRKARVAQQQAMIKKIKQDAIDSGEYFQ